MQAAIHSLNEGAEYFFEEGCFINELLNDSGDPALSVARARVESGKITRWHRLCGIAERYVLLAGTGLVEIEDLAPTTVGAGDVVCIPPGKRQRIANTGDDDLVFLAICTPRFVASAYVDTEDEGGV